MAIDTSPLWPGAPRELASTFATEETHHILSRSTAAAANAVHLLLLLGLSACAARSPAPGPAATARDAWTPMTWEARHDAMTFLVLPNMGRLFQRFDGKAAPDLTCRSCHGADAESVAYAMPHGLTALDPQHMPEPSGRVARFMAAEVTPSMADLLGVDRARFTCFGCHPRSR